MADCVIDLDQEWVSSLKKKVEAVTLTKHRRDQPRTIFRVPSNMRDGDPVSYEPQIISFGPFHRNKPSLQKMEQVKMRYLQKLLGRNPDAELQTYLKLIKEVEKEARASYSEEIDVDSNAFVEMMLLDGGFIVELFLTQNDGNRDDTVDEYEEEDPILTTNWTLPLIEYDMLMLENQIPFSVLERVFQLASKGSDVSLIKLLEAFFMDLLPNDRTIPSENAVPKFYHILHFFHSCIMPEKYQLSTQSQIRRFYVPFIYLKLNRLKRISSNLYRRVLSSLSGSSRSATGRSDNESVSPPPTPESVPCVTKLKEAGVKFKEKKAKSFLDVAFHDGTMEIPMLRVYDQTNSLFRNLIAFEQCFPEVGTHVATYALFMDCLVDTGSDVALLHRYGCIVNGLGNDDEAALLFNSLCKEVAVEYSTCYLAGLFVNVKKHCDSRWNKWRAKLMRDYFSNPWAMLSLAGAIILILLTVIQSWFAVLSYLRPPR